jgi:hypothetical protein
VNRGALIDPTDYIFQLGVEGQLDQADFIWRGQRLSFTIFFRTIRADRADAAALDIFRQAAIETGASLHLRQEIEQAANSSRLGGTTRPDQ